MRGNFTLVFVVSALMALMTTVVKAQDANNTWHLVAFENEKEVVNYDTEVITGIATTDQTAIVVLVDGKLFPHPIATTKFGFDIRREGTGVTNEYVSVPAWNVFYANGQLHFSETVKNVRIYNTYGALVAQVSGNYTDISINLSKGLNIVCADGKSAKLFVGNNGKGGTTSQPIPESQTKTNTFEPVNLRSSSICKFR